MPQYTLGHLDRVAAIKERLTRAIRDDVPKAEVTITTEPRALDDETIRERVMLIARNSGLAVHHVAVQALADRLSVSTDLEVDGTLPLSVAHETASRLEEAIREELGPDVEVETHIEPLPAALLADRDERVTALAMQACDASWSNWFAAYWLTLEGEPREEYDALFAGLEPVDHVARLGDRVLFQWAGKDTFVGEPVSRRTWIAMTVAVLGVGLMVGGPDHPSLAGVSLSLLMSVSFAAVIVCGPVGG